MADLPASPLRIWLVGSPSPLLQAVVDALGQVAPELAVELARSENYAGLLVSLHWSVAASAVEMGVPSAAIQLEVDTLLLRGQQLVRSEARRALKQHLGSGQMRLGLDVTRKKSPRRS